MWKLQKLHQEVSMYVFKNTSCKKKLDLLFWNHSSGSLQAKRNNALAHADSDSDFVTSQNIKLETKETSFMPEVALFDFQCKSFWTI